MYLVPTKGRMVVRRVTPKTETESGILLAAAAQEVGTEAVVVATHALSEAGIYPSDKVLLPKYGGTTIKFEGEDLLVIDESDILVKIQ